MQILENRVQNKGNPYPELPLYLNYIYSSDKEPQPYLLNF